MPRNRSAGIILKGDEILLMHRFNNGKEYYVFPGGGIEDGESPEYTCSREVLEETSIQISIKYEIYHMESTDGTQLYFFLCTHKGGEISFPKNAPERLHMKKDKSQTYNPLWFPIENLSEITLHQMEVRDQLILDLKGGFPETVQNINFLN